MVSRKVQLAKNITISAMHFSEVSVLSEFIGLGTLDPKNDCMENYSLWVSNGVIDTKANIAFDILIPIKNICGK